MASIISEIGKMIRQRLVFPIHYRLLRYPRLHQIASRTYSSCLRGYFLLRTGKPLPESFRSQYYISKDQGLIYLADDDDAQASRQVSAYQAEYEQEQAFDGRSPDVRVVAYHLPQFHETPENNAWWGDGFTDWTNTRKAPSLFPGHYQPREPHDDVGYYDLSDVESIRAQADLAKRHGIYGFCFYHYWFHGKRLLGKPVDILLENPDIDLPFCLCWANETWSKRWDGQDHHILMQQTFSPEDDLEFIKRLAPIFRDKRYIRVNGKPLLQVYRVSKLPSAKETATRWRDWCLKNGIGEIHLVAVCHGEVIPSENHLRDIGFDAYAGFSPHSFACKQIDGDKGVFDSGYRFDYKSGVESELASPKSGKFYESCTLGWDNTARFGKRATMYVNFSMQSYHHWLCKVIDRTREKFHGDQRLVFLNAWNEWAEGVYLEPDKKFGYCAINTTSKAIFGLPFSQSADEPSEKVNQAESAAKYTKDYEWLKFTIESGQENSLTKINQFVSDSSLVLEFGPAAGYYTRYLREERGATVDIIEVDRACAEQAAKFARRCFVGDVEVDDWKTFINGEKYDYIIFADVLEHLRSPLEILKACSAFLKPEGRILISVPNVAHWQILAALINNDFSYNSVGIMDHTHLRFFTEPTLREMVREAGLVTIETSSVEFPDLPSTCGTKWNVIKVPREIKRFLRSRAYAESIQIIVSAALPK